MRNYFEESVGTDEGRLALARHMREQAKQDEFGEVLLTAYRRSTEDDDVDPGRAPGQEDDQSLGDARQSARAYAEAVNTGAHIRTYAQDTESQKEGVAAALAHIARRKLSKIR